MSNPDVPVTEDGGLVPPTSSQSLPLPQQLSQEDMRQIASMVAGLIQPSGAGPQGQQQQNPLSSAGQSSTDLSVSSTSVTANITGKLYFATYLQRLLRLICNRSL